MRTWKILAVASLAMAPLLACDDDNNPFNNDVVGFDADNVTGVYYGENIWYANQLQANVTIRNQAGEYLAADQLLQIVLQVNEQNTPSLRTLSLVNSTTVSSTIMANREQRGAYYVSQDPVIYTFLFDDLAVPPSGPVPASEFVDLVFPSIWFPFEPNLFNQRYFVDFLNVSWVGADGLVKSLTGGANTEEWTISSPGPKARTFTANYFTSNF